MKAKDISSQNPHNLQTGDSVWQWKQWKLASIGGIVLPIPKPNPLSFSVFGLELLGLEPGDYIMVARNSSNNPSYTPSPLKEGHDANGNRILLPPLLKLEEVKDGCIGQIHSIELSAQAPAHLLLRADDPRRNRSGRIRLVSPLTVEGTDSVEGWPKVNGSITKIVGRDNTFVDEKQSSKVEQAKRLHGALWKEKTEGGVWLK